MKGCLSVLFWGSLILMGFYWIGEREETPETNRNEGFSDVSLSLSPDMLTLIDDYADQNELSRAAAVEELVELGMESLPR